MDDLFQNEGELPAPEVGDASPLLYNRRIAAYEWGGGQIIFSPIAGFNKKGFLTRNLVALDRGFIGDNDRPDMICLLAFLHEYRHYQQDYQTGVGHWDYVARTRHIAKTLSLAKGMSADFTAHEPLDPYMAGHVEGQSNCLLHREEHREISLIRDILATSEPNADMLAPLVTTRRILEADAVLDVYMLIQRVHTSEASAAALHALKQYYAFYEMPEAYSETLILALNSFNQRVKEDIGDAEKIENFLKTIRMLLIMSLAHPDPATIERLGHDATDYLPGVRFIRLMQASIKHMLAVDEHPPSLREFEASLIAKTGFPYPSFFDCETGWISYFKSMDQDPFPGMTEARSDTLVRKYRCGDGAEEAMAGLLQSLLKGSLLSFLDYDLPLLMRRSDGAPQDVLLTARGLAKPEYNMDRVRHVSAWRLSEFIARRRPFFSCPVFDTGYCKVETARCRQPFTDLSAVPISEDCRVRMTAFGTDRYSLKL
jgi:hypothetical protein